MNRYRTARIGISISLAVAAAGFAAEPASRPSDKSATAAPADPLQTALRRPLLDAGEAHAQWRAFLLSRAAKFTLPGRADDWVNHDAPTLRRRILDQVVFKGVPREWFSQPPRVEEAGRIETGKGYSIRKLRYEACPGFWVPALLYEPDGLQGRVPVVLNPNGHVGKPGKAVAYKQIRCINMARRGMIALNLEWIAMGELGGECYAHNRQAYLDLCGRSGVSVFYLGLKRGLDVLLNHPNADPQRVAVTGLSGGGWQTVFFSALDTRVTACAPNAGYISLDARADHVADIGDVEQNPADMVRIADYSHLTAMLAPRPALLIYNIRDDCCFPAERAKRCVYDPVLPLYEKLGRADVFRFHVNHDPGTHNYEKDNREALYRFLNRCFFPDGSPPDKEIACDDEVRKPEELNVGIPKDNADFCTMAAELARGLPRDRCPPGDSAAILEWQRQARERLCEIVRIKPAPDSWEARGEERVDGLHIVRRRLRVGDEWVLPAVEVSSTTGDAPRTAVVIADAGRASAAKTVRERLNTGCRVLAVDVVLSGEMLPQGFPAWQLAQMVSTVGERPLGVAAGQVLAAADCARREHPGRPVEIVGVGRTAGVIALIAAAADDGRIDAVTAVEPPSTLKLLIDEKADYAACPALFCFGLLERFDVRELAALCLPRKVTLVSPSGPPLRIEEELSPLDKLADTAGAPRVER